MFIGVPKEIKADEFRVGLIPSTIGQLVTQGHNVAETSRPTTHAQPVFMVHDVMHYCVANMPGAVPRTSTFALNHATRPFILALANKGFPRALVEDAHLRNGLNVHHGKVTCRAVADALGLPFTHSPPGEICRPPAPPERN
jgi:alanine dehydrogenase